MAKPKPAPPPAAATDDLSCDDDPDTAAAATQLALFTYAGALRLTSVIETSRTLRGLLGGLSPAPHRPGHHPGYPAELAAALQTLAAALDATLALAGPPPGGK